MNQIRLSSLLVLFMAIPLVHLAHNDSQIGLLLSEVLLSALVVVAFCASVLWLFVRFDRRGILTLFLLWLALSAWVQHSAFPWYGPVLDGRVLTVESQYANIGGEVVLWGVSLLLLLLLRLRFNWKGLQIAAQVLVFIALTTALLGSRHLDQEAKKEALALDPEQEAILHLSRKENVFLIILDEAQSDTALHVISGDEQLKRAFKDFSFYTDVAGGYQSTIASFPLIFSGQFFDNSGPYKKYAMQAYTTDDSIFVRFKSRGYKINFLPSFSGTYYPELRLHDNTKTARAGRIVNELSRLFDLGLFSALPGPLKNRAYRDGEWFISSRIARFGTPKIHTSHLPPGEGDRDTRLIDRFTKYAAVNQTEKHFFAIHLWGAHVPWNLTVDGKLVESENTAEAYRAKMTYKFRLLAAFLETLKNLKIYDSSAVLIIGDHGSGRTPELQIRGSSSEASPLLVKARAKPLLMSKGLSTNSSALTVLNTPVSFETFHQDIDILISNSKPLAQGPDIARRYVNYEWTEELGDYLLNFREYLIAGDTAENKSWWFLHRHEMGFTDFRNCVFHSNEQPIRFTRESISFDADMFAIEGIAGPTLLLKLEPGGVVSSEHIDIQVQNPEGEIVYMGSVGTRQAELVQSLVIPTSKLGLGMFRLTSTTPLIIADALQLRAENAPLQDHNRDQRR